MPDTACLHIQDREAELVRIVAIQGVSARIGRADYCEVYLPDPTFAEEECYLERHGRIWYLVPVGRPGAVRIGDHPVVQSRPIPYGVPFVVGDHRFILESSGDGSSGWGSFERPISLDVPPRELASGPAWQRDSPGEPELVEVPTRSVPLAAGSGPDVDDDRLSRFKARQEQRASWLRAREEEKRWEERWKAAGERLRSRAGAAVPTAPASKSPSPRPDSTRRPEPPPYSPPRRPSDVVSRTVGRSADVDPARPAPAPVPPREKTPATVPGAVLPVASAPPSSSRSAQASIARAVWSQATIARHPEPRPTSRETHRPPTPIPAKPPRDPIEVEQESTEPAQPLSPVSDREPTPAPIVAEPACQAASAPPDSLPSGVREDAENDASGRSERQEGLVEPSPGESWADPRLESPILVEAGTDLGDGPYVADTNLGRTEGWVEPDRFTSATATTEDEQATEAAAPRYRPSAGRRRRSTTRSGASRGRPAVEQTGQIGGTTSPSGARVPPTLEVSAARPPVAEHLRRLPTAREILDAHRGREAVAASVRVSETTRRSGNQPSPTILHEPGHWSVPLWLGWFPATLLAMALGAIGIVLAWGWSIEARHAGFIANRLARGGMKADPLPEWVTPPEPKWWKTTPGHLTLWALERDRVATDPAAVEEVHEFLTAATQASPMQAQARFAVSRKGEERGAVVADADADGSSLALSRDVVSLAWTAHRLLAGGKKEAALKAYREALEMASKADPARLAVPPFNDDRQVRRYGLPGEDLIGPIVADMAAHEGWTYAEWSTALPAFAVAPLAAARALRERSSPDASAPLDAILANADTPPPEGVPAAVHIAAQAEAFALKMNWNEAQRRYRQAIELMPHQTIRRSWFMNLAEIALRLDDESDRQKALEAAKGNDPNDEITRRAVDLLKSYGVRSERISSGDITANRSG